MDANYYLFSNRYGIHFYNEDIKEMTIGQYIDCGHVIFGYKSIGFKCWMIVSSFTAIHEIMSSYLEWNECIYMEFEL